MKRWGGEPFQRIPKVDNMYGRITLGDMIVELNDRATAAQRKSAYSSLNLSCLYKLGGCKDAEELAPAMWTPEDKVPPRDETKAPEPR